jgi:hypothetical protein
VFTTLGHDGQPQSTLVWVDLDRGCARVNTSLERQKAATCSTTRRSACSSSTPRSTSRFIQIRGDAELVTDGACEHLDALTRKYTSHPAYYGYIYPEAQRLRETRMICRSTPEESPSMRST